ncbi:MAG: hypothetical protein RIQ81_2211 [Pseudomonadota bacterium]|jgi:hypothetical protein
MMTILRNLMVSVAATAAIAAAGQAQAAPAYRMISVTTGLVVDSGRITVSPGYTFPAPLVTPRLAVQLAGPSCRASVISAQYRGNPRPVFVHRMNRFIDGSFEVEFGSVTWVAFEMSQAWGLPPSFCELRLFALVDDGLPLSPVSPGPAPQPLPTQPSEPSQPVEPGQPSDGNNLVQGGEELLGVLNYSGGFARQLPVVQSGRAPLTGLVTGIRVAIPEFCGQTEVLEAGTVSEGQFDAAAPAQSPAGAFIVNNGHGLRASDILVTLNGPFNAQCAIPVYVKIKR